jgi:hypothetical protein
VFPAPKRSVFVQLTIHVQMKRKMTMLAMITAAYKTVVAPCGPPLSSITDRNCGPVRKKKLPSSK